MKLVLATRNRGKVAELQRILVGLDVQLLSAADLDLPDVEETGTTFRANALLKARAAVEATGMAAVADDSGLEVAALDGAPGVRSARWAGDDAANNARLLAELDGVRDRRARFVCAAALVLPDGRSWTVEASLDGAITQEPRGSSGFGYDPLFEVAGDGRTSAELTPEDKDAVSHRGKAFRALRRPIAEVSGGITPPPPDPSGGITPRPPEVPG